jgi:hypothetical protein
MRVVFGPDVAAAAVAQDGATSRIVAQQIELAAQHDYWLMVYDQWGTKVFDTVVQARVLQLDGPADQVFSIARALPEDAYELARVFTAEAPAQVAWKRLPDGSFYLPLQWANHTNGRPNVGPFLVERWARGEKPDSMLKWRRLAPKLFDLWAWWVILTTLVSLYLWLRVKL